MSEQEARERDSLFGTSSRQSTASSRATNGHDPLLRAPREPDGGGGDLDAASATSWGGMTAPPPQQQQREQLSWAQVRDTLNVAERQRGLRSAYESVEVGRATLESLDDQKGISGFIPLTELFPFSNHSRMTLSCQSTQPKCHPFSRNGELMNFKVELLK